MPKHRDDPPPSWQPPRDTQPAPALADLCKGYEPEGQWSLRLVEVKVPLPLPGTYGHLALQVVAPDQRVAMEFHGQDLDPITKEPILRSSKGELGVAVSPGEYGLFDGREQRTVKELAGGTYADLKPQLEVLYAASQEINHAGLEYRGYSWPRAPQNSNSAARTLAQAIDHDIGRKPARDSSDPGVQRLLPLPLLDSLRGGKGAPVNVDRLDEMYQKLARQSGESVTVPDFDTIGRHPMNPACSLPDEASLGVAYNPDGQKQSLGGGESTRPLTAFKPK